MISRLSRVSFVCAAVLMTVFVFASCSTTKPTRSGLCQSSEPFVCPETRKDDIVDVYHGVKVPDPYRWLEDPDSPETCAWVKAQNKVSFGYLESIPEREAIEKRLTKLWNYERYGVPFRKGGRFFYRKNDGLQDQSVLYTTKSLDDEPEVLLDPNTFSRDGTVAINPYTLNSDGVSHDGRLLVYGVSRSGSDWVDLMIRDCQTGRDLPDKIEWVKFSGASWTKDNKGFFYARFDEPKEGEEFTAGNFFQKLYYHRVGTPQSQDELIFARTAEEEKDWSIGGSVTDDGRYLIISVRRGTERKNRVFFKDLQDPNGKMVGLINKFEALQVFVDNNGPIFWFRSFQDAPHGRIVAIDIRNPEHENWKEIVPESNDTLDGVNLINDMFVCEYLADV